MSQQLPTNADAGLVATDDGDELIDVVQVALEEFQGRVRPSTIDAWRTTARARPLPFVSMGGKRLYRRRDVRAFIAAHTHAGVTK